MLYKKWKERVFEPIQNTLRKKMDSVEYKIQDDETRKLFDDYLRCTTKQEVFLDTLSLEKYNPYRTIKLKVNHYN